MCVCPRGIQPLFIWTLCSKYLHPVFFSALKVSKILFLWLAIYQIWIKEIRIYFWKLPDSSCGTTSLYTDIHIDTHTHAHIHICLLIGPNIPLTLPPDKGSACHSCQWDFWVFNSLRVNPLQPQIDLISIGAKKDNLHIHGEKEQCWLNLTRVTFNESCCWFQLNSVNRCPDVDRKRKNRTMKWISMIAFSYSACSCIISSLTSEIFRKMWL